MPEPIDELAAALDELETRGVTRATSVRLPEALHRSVLLATELGMDESFTAAVTRALSDRVRDFVRRSALAEHFRQFPEDQPSLAAVVNRRVHGTDHPAAARGDLVANTAAWVASRRPDWATSGAVDEAVDEVLDYVEMLVAGVGGPQGRPA